MPEPTTTTAPSTSAPASTPASSGTPGGTSGSSSGSSRSRTANEAVARAAIAQSRTGSKSGANAGIPDSLVSAINKGAQPAPKAATTPSDTIDTSPGTEESGVQARTTGEGEEQTGDQNTESSTEQGEPTEAQPKQEPNQQFQMVARNVRNHTIKQIRQSIGLTAQETTADVRHAMVNHRRMHGDPRKFVTELAREVGLEVVPTGGPRQRMEGGDAGAVSVKPKPDLVSETGQKVYSADAAEQLAQFYVQQAMAKFEERLAPVEEFRTNTVQTQEQLEWVNRQRDIGRRALASARSMPHFKEHEREITRRLEYLAANHQNWVDEVGPVAALNYAYNTVIRDIVLPKLKTQGVQDARAIDRKKAVASTGTVTPNTGGRREGKPILKNKRDLSAHMANLERKAMAGVRNP